MPQQTVADILPTIRKYKIPVIPGIFSEDLSEDSAPQKVKEKAEKERFEKIIQDSKEARNKRIFDLWMACYTHEEIAERENVDKDTANEICQKTADLPKPDKSLAEHATNFDPPIYNIWKQQTKTEGSSHYGNSEVRWLDNLLYLYTKPFDVVVDPFAGGGSTIDICKKRFRRYWVSDRAPIIERETNIRKWDIVEGLPPFSG